jgi:hypothetical protein
MEKNYLLSVKFQSQPSTGGLLMTKRDTENFSQERENLSGYECHSCWLSFQFWSIKSHS